METTGAKAGSGDDAAPAADQERNQQGVSEESLAELAQRATAELRTQREAGTTLDAYTHRRHRMLSRQTLDMREREAALFGQFAPSLPMEHQVRRVISELINRTSGRQRPIAIYLGQYEYYTLRDQGPSGLSLDRDGDPIFDGIPIYPVALPSHLRVYGAPR